MTMTFFCRDLLRTFKICDYGVCDLEDLLLEISETSVVLTTTEDELMVAIPKREQTLDEVERTHQFAQECVELVRNQRAARLVGEEWRARALLVLRGWPAQLHVAQLSGGTDRGGCGEGEPDWLLTPHSSPT